MVRRLILFIKNNCMAKKILVPIEISARHIHLSAKDIETLFGKGYRIKPLKVLSQPAEFAAKEVVVIKTAKGELKVRILGPEREKTQIELSRTEAFKLGLNPPVRESHDLDGTPGLTVVGPKGSVRLRSGVIIAWRHIHSSPKQAALHGLRHGSIVSVSVQGERSLVFNQVEIKVNDDYDWHMHIDTDEANAAGLPSAGANGEVIIK